MPNYQKGKIYKVVCSETQNIYIGSTIQPLYKRLYGHKSKNNSCRSKEFIEPKIYLIEDYPCERKEQLEARERFFIEKLECVNCGIPGGRTPKQYYEKSKKTSEQYYQDNKDLIKEKNKIYYDKNKIKINGQRKKKYICICGSVYVECKKKRHEASQKHLNYIINNSTGVSSDDF